MRSSAYAMMLAFLGGCGMSDVYMLNSVGESAPLWYPRLIGF